MYFYPVLQILKYLLIFNPILIKRKCIGKPKAIITSFLRACPFCQHPSHTCAHAKFLCLTIQCWGSSKNFCWATIPDIRNRFFLYLDIHLLYLLFSFFPPSPQSLRASWGCANYNNIECWCSRTYLCLDSAVSLISCRTRKLRYNEKTCPGPQSHLIWRWKLCHLWLAT